VALRELALKEILSFKVAFRAGGGRSGKPFEADEEQVVRR